MVALRSPKPSVRVRVPAALLVCPRCYGSMAGSNPARVGSTPTGHAENIDSSGTNAVLLFVFGIPPNIDNIPVIEVSNDYVFSEPSGSYN